MPLYEYECSKCGKVFEVIQKFADAPLAVHEDCGGAVERLLSAPAFHLKGSGWYATDYAKSSARKAGEKADKASETAGDKSGDKSGEKSGEKSSASDSSSKSESKSDSSESKSEKPEKSSDSKPAATADKKD